MRFVTYDTYKFCMAVGPEQVIPEDLWPVFMAQARDHVEYYKSVYAFKEATTGDGDLTNTDLAICAVAGVLYSYSLARSGGGEDGVSSLSVGSVSVSFGKVAGSMDLSEKMESKAAYNAANRYLHFYRGVR